MAGVPQEINRPRLILVEGAADEAFFRVLVGYLKLTDNIQVIKVDGKTRFAARLAALANTRAFLDNVTHVGLCRDADDDPQGAFNSLCDALKKNNLPVPRQTLTLHGTTRKVVVTVLPGNQQIGSLESLCLAALHDQPAMTCVDQYVACLESSGVTIRDIKMPQTRLQAFLASRDDDELRFSIAVGQSWWPWEHPAFDEVKTFVNLVNDTPTP